MGKKPLFDDGEEEPQGLLRVNEDFALRFEHNKKREELHRLQEKYPEQAVKLAKERSQQAAAASKPAAGAAVAAKEGAGDSSSDGEDDDEGLIDERTQAQIFETLLKIRCRDQSIYDAQAKFYSSDSEEEEDQEAAGATAAKRKKEKPMYLKDVIYKQAVDGPVDSSDEEEAAAAARQQPRTYAQEQQELKHALLQAFEENVEGDKAAADSFGSGVLQRRAEKKRQQQRRAAGGDSSDEGEGEGKDGGGAGRAEGEDAVRVQQLLDGYFGRDAELSADDKFLKRYILNKGWVEGDKDEDYGVGHGEEKEVDDEEDEQFVKQAEQFEHAYNFRFEEPGATTIVTHPRNIESTVRKEDDKRKRARAEKAARQAAAEEQRQAEVRRLKNLKKAEIQEKLHEIQTVAGQAAPRQEVLDALVEGDFDPEEYDRQMTAAFGDDYYAGGEEEDEDELEDEAFERELEAMARYGSDEEDPQSFAALHKRLATQWREETAAGEKEESEEEGEGGGCEADPEAAARMRGEVQRLLEEYYKLNYEDVVGGVRTRFRYKEVAPDSFGLSVDEILCIDDRELNQVVGLKTLAPYREEHRRFRPNYQKLNKLRQAREEEQGQRNGGSQGDKPFGSSAAWVQREVQQGHQVQDKKWKHMGGGHQWRQDGQQPQQQQQQQQHENERQARPQKSVAERRLESFAKPTLKRSKQQQEGGDKKRKPEQQHDGRVMQQQKQKQLQQQPQQQQQEANGDGPEYSKTAKKNLKRREKKRAKTNV